MWKPIFKAVLIAGCLDITAAGVQAYSKGVTPEVLLKYIASGWFGKDAYTGGFELALFGLAVHFFIVFAIAITYFLLSPKLEILQKNIWFSAGLLAVCAWGVTTRVIIPVSRIEAPPFDFVKSLIAITILYFCIGLPIAFFAAKYFKRKVPGSV